MPTESSKSGEHFDLQAYKPLLATLLALAVVLATLYAFLWWQSGGPVSEYEGKMQVLASLQEDNTEPSVPEAERLDILRQLSAEN